MPTEVTKNEDGTWHAPGAGDHRTKREAEQALLEHQQDLEAARDARRLAAGQSDAESAVIAARPARRADTSGEGRTLDALGNPV